jgi:uncharacterized MAPEG superfamily protein
MTPELTALALAILLQGLYFAAYGAFGFVLERQVSVRYALSPRDAANPVSGRTDRAKRAEANYIHGLTLFAAAALLVAVAGQSSPFTAACAWLVLAARALYLPAYIWGWVPWRSLLWGVSYVATLLMALAALI